MGFLALAVGMYMRRKRQESAEPDAEAMATGSLDSNACLAPEVPWEREQSPEPGERSPVLEADKGLLELEGGSIDDPCTTNMALVPQTATLT